MTDPRRPTQPELTCDEVRDLAASFVLGALDEVEMAAVRDHLASCADPHAEVAELAGMLPVLDAGVRLVEPPPALKGRIMAAAAADLEARRGVAAPMVAPAPVAAPDPVAVPARVAAPKPVSVRAPRGFRWSWALGIAAAVAIALLGGGNLLLQSQLDEARSYERQLAAVLDAAGRPGALTAVMTSESSGGPAGLAAVTSDGVVRIAMRELAPTGGTEVYEAWVIVGDAAPVPLGAFQVGSTGVGYLEADGLPTESGVVLALTREPGPGATEPSGTPVSFGIATAAG
jgi:anti-sigma-K factor RskA